MNPKWLEWSQKLSSLALTGLHFTTNKFEEERYREILKIAEEIISYNSNLNQEETKAFFIPEKGYQTPKIDVRGAVFKDDKILLVRELEDGKFTLPGGFVDVGDSPSFACEREVFEESGYIVKAKKLIALYDRNKHPHPPYIFHLFKIFFLCELIGGEAANSKETSDADFFSLDNLPELSTGRTTFNQVVRCFEHYKNPALPTEFD